MLLSLYSASAARAVERRAIRQIASRGTGNSAPLEAVQMQMAAKTRARRGPQNQFPLSSG
jgi:hypothetical protein